MLEVLIDSDAQIEIGVLDALVERNEQVKKFYEKEEGVLYDPGIAD